MHQSPDGADGRLRDACWSLVRKHTPASQRHAVVAMSLLCPSCRGSAFEDIDDELFCATPGCGVRVGGQKTVAESAFQGTEVRLTQEVRQTTSQQVSSRTVDSGYSWSTYEAFNLILVHQVNFLITSCGAPDHLRSVVLALWAAFLSKSEVAFVDGSQEPPKLPITSRQRDIALLARGLQSIPAFKSAPACKTERTRVRLGAHVYAKRRAATSSSDQEDPKEQIIVQDCDPALVSNHELNQPLKTELESVEALVKERLEVEPTAAASEASGSSTDYEEELLLPSKEVGRKRETGDKRRRARKKRRRVERAKKAEREQPFILEEHEMNSASLEVCKGFSRAKDTRYRLNHLHSDFMDLRTTLAFLFIACRFLDLDIHLTDLLHWINQGFLVYFAVTRLFPDDWHLMPRDHQTFSPNATPSPYAVLTRAAMLVHLLEVPLSLPVDMMQLLERLLHEMNLPSDLLSLIRSQSGFEEDVRSFGDYKMHRKQVFRFYELHAVAVIMITLRKTFGTGSELGRTCDLIRRLDASGSAFCLDEWIEASKLRVLALKQYFLPLYQRPESEVRDARLVSDFHARVTRHWYPSFSASREQQSSDETIAGLFRRLDTRCDEEGASLPGPSRRFLQDACAFVQRRVTRHPLLQQALSQDFRGRKVDFLRDSRFPTRRGYTCLTPRGCKRWHELATKSPVEVRLQLQLASWLLHSSAAHLLPLIKRIEKTLFSQHFCQS